jgi:septum formation protein
MEFILASASPRRKQLLEQLGYEPKVCPVHIDETPLLEEDSQVYVERMARHKLLAALESLPSNSFSTPRVLLASDTTVIADGKILGKPTDFPDYVSMMSLLSGAKHQVSTSFALAIVGPNGVQREHLETVTTDVVFRPLSSSEIEGYWETGEPIDKAGGYGIQGAAAAFVERISGSYSSVVGLPLMEVAKALDSFGLPLFIAQNNKSR